MVSAPPARGKRVALERFAQIGGLSPARARQAALEQLVPGGEALERLEVRHAPSPRRWARATGWLDHAVRVGVGAAATLAGAVAFTLAASGSSGVSAATGAVAGTGATAVLMWSQVLLVALLAANLAWAAARLWIHGDLRPAGRRLLWARQGGLIVAAVAFGALGAAWKGYLLFAGADLASISSLSLWSAVRGMARVAAVGLGTAIFGLFGWLAITPRLITDEEIERRIARFFAQASPPVILAPRTPPIRDSNSIRGRQ